MWTVVAIAVIFVIVIFAEYLSRYKGVHSELTRKMVHILVGLFVAFWPFFLSWRQIQLLSFLFLATVIWSIKFNIFGSIHAVARNKVGEVAFALVIGILSLISSKDWIFTAAMLHLSVADGFAAVFGLAYGEGTTYKIMG